LYTRRCSAAGIVVASETTSLKAATVLSSASTDQSFPIGDRRMVNFIMSIIVIDKQSCCCFAAQQQYQKQKIKGCESVGILQLATIDDDDKIEIEQKHTQKQKKALDCEGKQKTHGIEATNTSNTK
jgi:hypothetical protein